MHIIVESSNKKIIYKIESAGVSIGLADYNDIVLPNDGTSDVCLIQAIIKFNNSTDITLINLSQMSEVKVQNKHITFMQECRLNLLDEIKIGNNYLRIANDQNENNNTIVDSNYIANENVKNEHLPTTPISTTTATYIATTTPAPIVNEGNDIAVNPAITNSSIANSEITDPEITGSGIINPDITSPSATDPDVSNPEIPEEDNIFQDFFDTPGTKPIGVWEDKKL